MKENTSKHRAFLNAFNLIPELGPVKLAKISAHPDLGWLWGKGLSRDFLELGLDDKAASAVLEKRATINVEEEFAQLAKHSIRIVTRGESEYPALLKEIANPPPLLYIRGTELVDQLRIAIVGTRKISSYGKQVVAQLVPQLVSHGLGIVSGLAFGTDAEALELAAHSGGSCVAVMAGSLDDDSISPRSNLRLAHEVMESGALVSEYPLGTQVYKQHFPVRNRLISGMSMGTLVIEADEKSGSLITAKFALEQNRAVMAVPGSVFSQASRGTNWLIKNGAKVITTAADVLEELNLDLQAINSTVNFKAGSKEEELVLKHLNRKPSALEELIKETKLSPSEVTIALSMLELAGRVKNLGNGNYVRIF